MSVGFPVALHHAAFDRAFYLRKYRDVKAALMNPEVHYWAHGAAEGRKPHPLFDPGYYAKQSSDVSPGAEFVHFLEQRGRHCPAPHPLFDCASYVRVHPDAERTNPLLHSLARARRAPIEGRQFECAS